MSDPLGVDLAVTTDLDPTFRLCHGIENLGNAQLRRLNCDACAMASIGEDSNYGENIVDMVSGENVDLPSVNARVVAQLSQDERIQAVQARVIAVADKD
jgi:hypothetical protein